MFAQDRRGDNDLYLGYPVANKFYFSYFFHVQHPDVHKYGEIRPEAIFTINGSHYGHVSVTSRRGTQRC